jgi:hypothetical protein
VRCFPARVFLTCIVLIATVSPGRAMEFDYVSMRFIGIGFEPQSAWSSLNLNQPLAEFDCWLGGARTTCILPNYQPTQLKKFSDWAHMSVNVDTESYDNIIKEFRSDHRSRFLNLAPSLLFQVSSCKTRRISQAGFHTKRLIGRDWLTKDCKKCFPSCLPSIGRGLLPT